MVEELVTKLIAREGGYVHHPLDLGGPTNMGITLKTLSRWRGYRCTATHVNTLAYEEAADIYISEYWEAPKLSQLSVHVVIQEMLFDAAVHHGPGRSVRLLQRATGVKVDGLIGPKTRAIVRDMDPVKLSARLIGARVAYIGKIITRLPSQSVFAAGWASRMEEFIVRVAEI